MKIVEGLSNIQVLATSGINLEYVQRFELGITYARCFACFSEKAPGLGKVKPDSAINALRFVVPKGSRTTILAAQFAGIQYIHVSDDKEEKWIDIGACSDHEHKLNHLIGLVRKYQVIDMRIVERARSFDLKEV